MNKYRKLGLSAFLILLWTCSAFAQSSTIATYVGSSLPVDGASAVSQSIEDAVSVTSDGVGGFYVVSRLHSRVYRVIADGSIHLAAGSSVGNGGDGGPATSAQLNRPNGIAADAAGNLYIADTANHRVRKVAINGVISTVAGTGLASFGGDGGAAISAFLSSPTGIAVDTAGNLYIADTANHRIRKVSTNGVIGTVAGTGVANFGGDGGQATLGAFNSPQDITVDAAGNIYIADTANNRIRKVATNGVISTIAGMTTPGYSGDGGPATLAEIISPSSVAVDAAGNLYIVDTGNDRIRKVTFAGPVLTNVGPTAGIVGNSVNVTLTGSNFISGMTVVDAMPGVAVSSVIVVNSTTMTATFTIDPAASPGSRNVTVSAFPGGTSAAATFTVTGPTALTLVSITPSSGSWGGTVPVTLTGFNFLSGLTINAGVGLQVSNVSVQSSTLATATLTIDGSCGRRA